MKRVVLGLAILLALYGVFEARRLIEGPVITVASPIGGTATSSTLVTIAGTAENISFLTIDDKPAFTDIAGHFSVTLSQPPGIAIITVAALDRFGRRAKRQVDITVLNYCPIS